MDIEQADQLLLAQAPQNRNQEILPKVLKAAQLILAGSTLVISLALLSPKLSEVLRHRLVLANLFLNVFISILAGWTARIPLIGRFCCLPLVEFMAIGNFVVSFTIAMGSQPHPPKFYIPSFCLGISVASFVIRLQDMLGIIFGIVVHPNSPPIPASPLEPFPAATVASPPEAISASTTQADIQAETVVDIPPPSYAAPPTDFGGSLKFVSQASSSLQRSLSFPGCLHCTNAAAILDRPLALTAPPSPALE